jgi:hypothetical protein
LRVLIAFSMLPSSTCTYTVSPLVSSGTAAPSPFILISLRAGLVNVERAALELSAVQSRFCLLGSFPGCHFDKPEAFAFSLVPCIVASLFWYLSVWQSFVWTKLGEAQTLQKQKKYRVGGFRYSRQRTTQCCKKERKRSLGGHPYSPMPSITAPQNLQAHASILYSVMLKPLLFTTAFLHW